jgi:predicted transcriptional regulator
MRSETRHRLTKCELEIMDVIWEHGPATVQDVCDRLARPLAYSSVMTMLRILETKRDALQRTKHGRAYVYEPLITRDEATASLLSELRDHAFRGSMTSLVLNLLGEQPVSREDIRALKAALEQLEKDS